MQPEGPYQLVEALGSCQVGGVWSAVDPEAGPLTVARLDAAFASDVRWRDAFAATANALHSKGNGPKFVYADFSAPTPWVACEGGEGPGAEQVFIALGLEYRTLPAGESSSQEETPQGQDGGQVSPVDSSPASTHSTAAGTTATGTTATGAEDESAEQLSDGLPGQGEPSPEPVSGGAPATTATAATPAVAPQLAPAVTPAVTPELVPAVTSAVAPELAPATTATEPSTSEAGLAPPFGGIPRPASSPFNPGYPPILPVTRSRPPRRTGLWVTIAVVLVAAIATTTAIFVSRGKGDTATTPTASPSSSSVLAVPTAVPLHPGIEPPKSGVWPTTPKFGDADQVKTLADLDDLGFWLKVPQTWECVAADHNKGEAKYHCGVSLGATTEVGGEIAVRDCQKPCNEERRTAFRTAEEAWGLQWRRIGMFSTYAETKVINGEPKYGLVVVGWWRSVPEDAIDREIVIRMTAPLDRADEIRKVANGIRDTIYF